MFDFFDMPTLLTVLQEVTEELDKGNNNASVDFAKHILSVDIPCTVTPLCNLYTEENAVIRYAQQFLKYNQELGIDHAVEALAQHAARFDYADTPTLTPKAATIVLKKGLHSVPLCRKSDR